MYQANKKPKQQPLPLSPPVQKKIPYFCSLIVELWGVSITEKTRRSRQRWRVKGSHHRKQDKEVLYAQLQGFKNLRFIERFWTVFFFTPSQARDTFAFSQNHNTSFAGSGLQLYKFLNPQQKVDSPNLQQQLFMCLLDSFQQEKHQKEYSSKLITFTKEVSSK